MHAKLKWQNYCLFIHKMALDLPNVRIVTVYNYKLFGEPTRNAFNVAFQHYKTGRLNGKKNSYCH